MPLSSVRHVTLERLRLNRAPVAIAFLDEAPSDLPHAGAAEAAGCGFWRRAAEGQAFYTTADDHQGCPVGAFTHGVELTPAKTQELQSLVGTMIELRYLKSDEVAGIPHRPQAMRVAAYAPLDRVTFKPDVVVFRGTARQIMLLSEAARAAGVFNEATAMGRPACAMLPYAIERGSGVASVACIGNRVYTGLADDEMYIAVPGHAVGGTLDELEVIMAANEALESFHRQRASAVTV